MKFFTAFPNDWLTGTADLTAEETGAFWNLCCFYMAKDGVAPDNDAVMCRVVKLGARRWRAVKQRLIEGCFIEIRDGHFWQEKCEDRLKKDGAFVQSQRDRIAKRWAQKRAENGLKTKDKNEIISSRNDTKQLENNDTHDTPVSTAVYTTPSPSSLLRKDVSNVIPIEKGEEGNLKAKIFGECLAYLIPHIKSRITDPKKRREAAASLLGRWRKEVRDGTVVEIVSDAQRRGISDPIPYIEKAVNGRKPKPLRGGAQPADIGLPDDGFISSPRA
jgi:uncharacterized protein YdaU (DUF1376 family)